MGSAVESSAVAAQILAQLIQGCVAPHRDFRGAGFEQQALADYRRIVAAGERGEVLSVDVPVEGPDEAEMILHLPRNLSVSICVYLWLHSPMTFTTTRLRRWPSNSA